MELNKKIKAVDKAAEILVKAGVLTSSAFRFEPYQYTDTGDISKGYKPLRTKGKRTFTLTITIYD